MGTFLQQIQLLEATLQLIKMMASFQVPIVEAKEVVLLPPEMVAICESNNKQFNKDGSIVISHTEDYGRWQINKVHLPEAKELGLDVMTLEGNNRFASVLYQRDGLRPWEASKACCGQLPL